jgi:hypothetical protein
MIELSKTDWRDIIFRIKKNESIVVLGPGAITDEAGIPLYNKLCEALESELSTEAIHHPDRLFMLSEQMLQQKAGESILIDTAEKVFKPVGKSALASKLCQIPFHLYISTVPDHSLFRAFENNSINCNREFYNYNSSPRKVAKPTVDAPLIYHLLGSIDEDDSLILTYDNLFDFLFAILGPKQLPIEIRDELRRARNYIFLGFDFEEWYLKIILRLFELHNDKNSYAYAWKPLQDNTLTFYANEFKLDFVNGQINEFVDELYQRCVEEKILRERKKAPPITEKLKGLLAESQIAEAIDLMDNFLSDKNEEDLLNQVFMISGRYNRLLQKQRKGVVSEADANVELNQVTASLLDIVKDIEQLAS